MKLPPHEIPENPSVSSKISPKMIKLLSSIRDKVSIVFNNKPIRTLEEATAERKEIFSIIERLEANQKEEKVGLQAAKEIAAHGGIMSDQRILGEAFLNRQKDCFNVYDKILPALKRYKKLFRKRAHTNSNLNNATITEYMLETQVEPSIKNLHQSLFFKVVDEHVGVRFIRSPEELIKKFVEIKDIMSKFLNNPTVQSIYFDDQSIIPN